MSGTGRLRDGHAAMPNFASMWKLDKEEPVPQKRRTSDDQDPATPSKPSQPTGRPHRTSLANVCARSTQRRRKLERAQEASNEHTPDTEHTAILWTLIRPPNDPGPADHTSPGLRKIGASTSLGSAFDCAALDTEHAHQPDPGSPRSPLIQARTGLQDGGNCLNDIASSTSGLLTSNSCNWKLNGVSYTEAIRIAMEGGRNTLSPYLDATNAGDAEYFGVRVLGSFGRAGAHAIHIVR